MTVADAVALLVVENKICCAIGALDTFACTLVWIKLLVGRAVFLGRAFASTCVMAEVSWRSTSLNPSTITLTCFCIEHFISGAGWFVDTHTAASIAIKVLALRACLDGAVAFTSVFVKNGVSFAF